MNARAEAEKILKELNFDFATFTMSEFLRAAGQSKGREMIALPWSMPSTLFGAWISNDEDATEYIFYRDNISETHQIHVQLHELSHFLFGHPTLKINQKRIVEVMAGRALLPFAELPKLRSPRLEELEAEAETLASLIQKQVVQHAKLAQLTCNLSVEENFAHFMKTMRLT